MRLCEAHGLQDWRGDTSWSGRCEAAGPRFVPLAATSECGAELGSARPGPLARSCSLPVWVPAGPLLVSVPRLSLLTGTLVDIRSHEVGHCAVTARLNHFPYPKNNSSLEGKSQSYVLEIGQNNSLSFYLCKF